MTADAGPLAGLTVLDLTRLLPGAVCTLHLADLGADVIKIEDTGAGDYARALDASPGSASAFYRVVNRNKRSVALNLKDARAQALFLALADAADVIVEGFRPGVVKALGVDYTTIAARNPRIVYASITGHGQDGPRALHAGHDINYLGYAGVLDQTGCAGGPPALSNLQVADLLGGAATTTSAILAALVGVPRTGVGRYIDVSMTDATLAHNIFALHALEQWGATRARGTDLLDGGVPCYGVYATSDGRYMAVGALEAKFWQRLCATLGRDDLSDGHLATGAAGERVRAALAATFAAHPFAHWCALFATVDCCVTPVASLEEALADPQFIARQMVVTGPDGARSFAPPARLSGHHFTVIRAAPRHGEHTRAVLAGLGVGAHRLAELAAAGAIRVDDGADA